MLFLCIAFGAGGYFLLDTWRFDKSLPKIWSSIREIELSPGTEESVSWLKQLQIPVILNKDGNYKLQILFVPWEEGGKVGTFIQYDLVDLKSENSNTVWETTRTFILSDESSWVENIIRPRKAHRP